MLKSKLGGKGFYPYICINKQKTQMKFSQVKVGDRFKITKAATDWFLHNMYTKFNIDELIEIVEVNDVTLWVNFKVVDDECKPPTSWGLNCYGHAHDISYYLKLVNMKATLENGITIELTQEQLASIEAQMKPKKVKEQRFQELLSQIDIHQPKVDFGKYPNTIFWFDKNGKYFCEYDWKNGDFWFSYQNVWEVFRTEFNLNYQETMSFLNDQVEEHFKLKGVTTEALHGVDAIGVEEHFKLKK